MAYQEIARFSECSRAFLSIYIEFMKEVERFFQELGYFFGERPLVY